MAQLQKLLAEQFQQRNASLEDYAKAEVEWKATLKETTIAWQKAAEDQSSSAVAIDSDMDADDDATEETPYAASMEEIKAGQQQLMAALAGVQAAAQQGAKRDGSRTPRRRGKDEDGEPGGLPSSSPDPWKLAGQKPPGADSKPEAKAPASASAAMKPFPKPHTDA